MSQHWVCRIRIVEDVSMAPGKFALVNDDGRGFSCEDGEIVPCILPPPPPRIALLPPRET